MNSKSASFPDGLANGSGKLGQYIMDTTGARLGGRIPAEGLPPHNEEKAGKLDFPRGYHIELGGSRGMPSGSNPVPEGLSEGSYGKQSKEDARRYYGSSVGFASRAEMIPNDNCEIDPEKKAKWSVRSSASIGNGRTTRS